jgi:GT2 family glycosyltransferase
MKVSIITINYNGFNDTCELIDSLKKFETMPFEIIVVDNASAGNDGPQLAEKYPEVKVVCSKSNLGFAGGNNLGLKEASGDFFLFMNNDMLIKGPFLKPLVDRLLSSENIGLVSPKIKYTYAPDVIQYAGYSPMSSIMLRNNLIGLNQHDAPQFSNAMPTDSAHGACMMTRRECLDRTGKMTEIYFLFYEEHDWSERFREAGYEVWYEPASTVYHKESMTIKRGTPLRLFYLTRARIMYARRNCHGFCKFMACSYQLLLAIPKQTLLFLVHGDFSMVKALWKGFFNGLCKKID